MPSTGFSEPTALLLSRTFTGCLVALGALFGARGAPVSAQTGAWQDESRNYRRSVHVSDSEPVPAVLVVDFFAHGGLQPGGKDVVAYSRDEPIPVRVLQTGPGDYCRIAIQPPRDKRHFTVYYGGTADARGTRLEWPPTPGLMLETRQWKPCDLNKFEDVRRAYEAAPTIGADYVPHVFHRENPFSPTPAPFLSRYTGTLQIPLAGKIQFFTSSQDCSFLLIDDHLVVAAPGAHPPQHQARIKGEITLTEGPHRFEYWHAAASPAACMVAAWQLPGFDKPQLIGVEPFHNERIGRAVPTRLERRPGPPQPDFRLQIVGETPLADVDTPLVRVRFADLSLPIVSEGAKYHWDFGDGQHSTQKEPQHVYLHPGVFKVTLSLRRSDHALEVSSRVEIAQPPAVNDPKHAPDALADYLSVLDAYDPAALDPLSLVQLVRVRLQSDQVTAAVAAGRTALVGDTPATAPSGLPPHDDASRWQIASLLGPIIRDLQLDPAAAAQWWRDAGKSIKRPDLRAACALEAADVQLTDLGHPAEAKPLLEFALTKLGDDASSQTVRAWRLRGDLHARQGEGPAARSAYLKAQARTRSQRSPTQQSAWRGAHSRSVEAFLRDDDLDRALDQLREWQAEFPADMLDGYLTLLWARYWDQRKKPELAAALAGDLLTVNAASPYADRLLDLAARAELKLGRRERAVATWQSLVVDYPGSPLAPAVKQELEKLGAPAAPARSPPRPTKSK